MITAVSKAYSTRGHHAFSKSARRSLSAFPRLVRNAARPKPPDRWAYFPGLTIITCEVPTAFDTTVLVAETTTVAGLGTVRGDMYTPGVLIVPGVELPPVMPFTS